MTRRDSCSAAPIERNNAVVRGGSGGGGLLQLEERLRARRRGHGLEQPLQAVVLVAQVADELLDWVLVHHRTRLDSLRAVLRVVTPLVFVYFT